MFGLNTIVKLSKEQKFLFITIEITIIMNVYNNILI